MKNFRLEILQELLEFKERSFKFVRSFECSVHRYILFIGIVAVDFVCVCCFICPSWHPHHMWPCLKHAWFIRFGFWTKKGKTVNLLISTSIIELIIYYEKNHALFFLNIFSMFGLSRSGSSMKCSKSIGSRSMAWKCESWLILAEVATGVTRVRGYRVSWHQHRLLWRQPHYHQLSSRARPCGPGPGPSRP